MVVPYVQNDFFLGGEVVTFNNFYSANIFSSLLFLQPVYFWQILTNNKIHKVVQKVF